MNFTEKDKEAVLQMAAKDLADRLFEKIEGSAEDLALYTINRAAGLLDLTPGQVHKILDEFIDFGPRDRRLSARQVKMLIAKRTIGTKRR